MRNLDAWRALRAPFLTGLALGIVLLLLPLAALGGGEEEARSVPTLPASPTPAVQPPPTLTPGAWDGAQTQRQRGQVGQVAVLTLAG